MEKVKDSKRGSKKYIYWMASCREGDKVRNVHLEACRKLSRRPDSGPRAPAGNEQNLHP